LAALDEVDQQRPTLTTSTLPSRREVTGVEAVSVAMRSPVAVLLTDAIVRRVAFLDNS